MATTLIDPALVLRVANALLRAGFVNAYLLPDDADDTFSALEHLRKQGHAEVESGIYSLTAPGKRWALELAEKAVA